MSIRRKIRPCYGFTLIELLVSISIIGVLAALLIPAIMQSRAATRRTVCQSNLRNWALAVRMYADTHHGRLPYRGQGIQPTSQLASPDDWFNALPAYVESPPYIELVRAGSQPKPGDASVWMCPDAEHFVDVPLSPFNPNTFFAYSMNMALSTPYMGRPDHIDRIGELQTLVFMTDGIGKYCSAIPHKDDYTPIARHVGGTVNIAFMDGHVESITGDEVGCRVGDPHRPDIVWFPPNCKWPGPPK